MDDLRYQAHAVEPVEWNVVVAGAWNLAILTPQGVARRLFKLEPDAGVEVEVALDGPAPLRIIHSGIMVIPAARQLIVQPQIPSPESLVRAGEIAANAVMALPETPIHAAGINLRYKFDGLPETLIGALHSGLDDALGEAELRIEGRSMKRTLSWTPGHLNLEIVEGADASGLVVMNYHHAATIPAELSDWLGKTRAVCDHAIAFLQTTLKIKLPKESS
jgi:hypothetical protein